MVLDAELPTLSVAVITYLPSPLNVSVWEVVRLVPDAVKGDEEDELPVRLV